MVVVHSDFEDGTSQGWSPLGGETLTVSTAAAHNGARGLLVSGRTQTWEGGTRDLLGTVRKGLHYGLSIWVRGAAPEATAQQVRLTIERHAADGTRSYDPVVGNTTVTSHAWVNLTGGYTLASDVAYLHAYLETTGGVGPLYIDDFTLTHEPNPPVQTGLPALKKVLAGRFPIGAAIRPAQTLGDRGDLLAHHFSSVTPTDALKWDATEPSEGVFRYVDADPIIAFATTHGMAVRGHTLVWHQQTPDWVFRRADGTDMTGTAADKALLLSRLERHVRDVAGRYRDHVDAWDVVNEVIDESRADGLLRSKWYTIAGLDFIRTAFRVAREAAPHAKLFINDYHTYQPARRDKLFALVSTLRSEGVPVDGVGHQMHITIDQPPLRDAETMLDLFATLGVEQQVTEMDVSIYTDNAESFPVSPRDRLIRQAYRYRDFFDLYRRHANQLTSVTLWGLADDDTWLDFYPVSRKDAPLLFDRRLQAKPAYWGIVDPTRIDPAGCRARYTVVSQWPGGFHSDVRITNTDDTATSGWTLRFTLGTGQRISQAWNAIIRQDGTTVTATNAAWNGTISSGGAVDLGFIGQRTGANTPPSAFTLNGADCTTEAS